MYNNNNNTSLALKLYTSFFTCVSWAPSLVDSFSVSGNKPQKRNVKWNKTIAIWDGYWDSTQHFPWQFSVIGSLRKAINVLWWRLLSQRNNLIVTTQFFGSLFFLLYTIWTFCTSWHKSRVESQEWLWLLANFCNFMTELWKRFLSASSDFFSSQSAWYLSCGRAITISFTSPSIPMV